MPRPFSDLRKPLGLFWLEVRRDIATALSLAQKWHAMPEGKAAIYGSLFFVAVTFGQHGVLMAVTPNLKVEGAISQEAEKLLTPCKHDGAKYLYGVRMRVTFRGKNKFKIYDACHASDGTWIW